MSLQAARNTTPVREMRKNLRIEILLSSLSMGAELGPTASSALVNFDLESQESGEKVIYQIFEIATPLIVAHAEDGFDSEVAIS
jgi:hypothetical protein